MSRESNSSGPHSAVSSLSGVRLGQRLAPTLGRALGMRKATRLASIYLDVIQGFGSGTGWDMDGEVKSISAVLEGIREPVVIDGGANVGTWTKALHRTLGHDRSHFYLVEPQESCNKRLKEIGVPGCVVVPVALGSSPAEAILRGERPSSEIASLYERHDTYFGDTTAHTETVTVATLDDLIADLKLITVDLLKLDLEGGEFDALMGASSSLENGAISAIAFEFGAANLYSRVFFRDFWELLNPLGYAFSRVIPGGALLRIPDYSEELEHFRGVSNYLAVRRNHLLDRPESSQELYGLPPQPTRGIATVQQSLPAGVSARCPDGA
jgi:FkbM family methyltransferase